MLRIRDFIETKDRLIFSVTSYYHPNDRYLAFLRYALLEQVGGIEVKKHLKKSLQLRNPSSFLKKIFKTCYPPEKLKEIYEKLRDALEQKVVALSELFSEIPEDKKGVNGSILLNLHEKDSDIDFVVYGTKNYENAREILRQLFEENKTRPLSKEEWLKSLCEKIPWKRCAELRGVFAARAAQVSQRSN